MKLTRKHTVQAGKFSMAAMSDLAFLLIIFFMVCAKFVEKSDVQVDLPLSMTGEKAEDVPITISINADKLIFVNGVPMLESELLAEMRGRLRGAQGDEEKSVIVCADRSLKYRDVRPAVDAVDRAGGILELSVLSE